MNRAAPLLYPGGSPKHTHTPHIHTRQELFSSGSLLVKLRRWQANKSITSPRKHRGPTEHLSGSRHLQLELNTLEIQPIYISYLACPFPPFFSCCLHLHNQSVTHKSMQLKEHYLGNNYVPGPLLKAIRDREREITESFPSAWAHSSGGQGIVHENNH